MARRLPLLLAVGAVGLLAGWLWGRSDWDASSSPPSIEPGPAPAAELPERRQPAPSPPPHARGEPAAAPSPQVEQALLLPVQCDLPMGPTPPDSLRISWRATVLGDPAIEPSELLQRIRGRSRDLPVVDGHVDLRLPPQADVLLLLDGDRVMRAMPLAWQDDGGHCLDDGVLLPSVPVSGRVRGLQPGDQVEVFLCGRWLAVAADGSFSGKAPATALCLAFASRSDGMLSAIGELVDLDLSQGGVLPDLELELPDYEMAGVGAALQVAEGGVEVLQAVPGGPAEAAGLVEGDLVVMVDGEEIDGWELAEAVAAITGPEGTEVELLVEGTDGEERRVVVVREPIPAQDQTEPAAGSTLQGR